jgi:hypothetical protein
MRTTYEAELATIDAELAGINAKIDNLLDAIENGLAVRHATNLDVATVDEVRAALACEGSKG